MVGQYIFEDSSCQNVEEMNHYIKKEKEKDVKSYPKITKMLIQSAIADEIINNAESSSSVLYLSGLQSSDSSQRGTNDIDSDWSVKDKQKKQREKQGTNEKENVEIAMIATTIITITNKVTEKAHQSQVEMNHLPKKERNNFQH